MKSNLPSQSVSFYQQRVWWLGFLAFVTFIWLTASGFTPFFAYARVPLLSLVLFAVVVPVLAGNNLKSLLIGAYDLSGFRDGMILGLLLVLCGMTIYTTATLCMELGPVRVEGRGIVPLSLLAKSVLSLGVWAGIVGNAVLARNASGSLGRSQNITAHAQEIRRSSTIGLVVGIAAGGLAWIVIAVCVQHLQGDLNAVVKANPWLAPIQSITEWVKSTRCDSQCRGYISIAEDTKSIELKHVGAAISFLITGVLYLRLRRASVIAIGYVLLLLVVLTWGLTALSFFLDLYRVPLLIPLGFWLLFATFHPKTDHYYPILTSEPGARRGSSPPFTPADLLGRAVERNEPIFSSLPQAAAFNLPPGPHKC